MLCFEGLDVKGDDFDWFVVVVFFDIIRGFGWDFGEFVGVYGWGCCDDFGFVVVLVGFLCYWFNLDYFGFVFFLIVVVVVDFGIYELKYVG